MCVEGIVGILLDGGALVNVRNRKNQLPIQLTLNINIMKQLSSAAQYQPQSVPTAAADAGSTTTDTAVCLLTVSKHWKMNRNLIT